MRKSNFTRFVQDGRLIEFHFEPEPMRDVLNEILVILAHNDQRINQIDSRLPSFALQTQIDELTEKNKELQKNIDEISQKYEQSLIQFETNLKKQLDDMREFVENSNSVVLVDVRRYMLSQIEDVMKLSKNKGSDGDNDAPNNVGGMCADLQQSVDNMVKDINKVRKVVDTKISQDQLKTELDPIVKNLEHIDEIDADMLTIRLSLKQLSDKVNHVETVQKTPGTRVEVVVQKPIQPPIPPPPETPKTPSNINITQNHPVSRIPSTTYNGPPIEDMSSLERQIRRMNEMSNGLKLAIDELNQRLSTTDDKLSQSVSQSNMKHIQVVQDVDQLRGHFERLKEQIAAMSGRDYSRALEDLNSRLDSVHREVNDVNDKQEKRNKVVRPDIRYVERVLPPLQTQPENFDQVVNDNENFGLMDSSENLLPSHHISHGSSVQNSSVHGSVVNSVVNSNQSSTPNTGRKTIDEEVPSPSLSPELMSDRSIKSGRKKEPLIKIIRTPMGKSNNNSNNAHIHSLGPSMTTDEIQEKVDHAIKASLAGFLDRAKVETQKEVANGLKVVDQVSAQIERKIDRDFVERMFNKFRIVVADLKDKIDQIQCTFLGWVTREELQQVLEKFVEQLQEVKDTAGASSKYKCLLCGRPRTHISGMILNDILRNDENEDDIDYIENEEMPKKVMKKSISRAQSPMTLKRGQTPPIPRDVIQLLTSTDARK